MMGHLELTDKLGFFKVHVNLKCTAVFLYIFAHDLTAYAVAGDRTRALSSAMP